MNILNIKKTNTKLLLLGVGLCIIFFLWLSFAQSKVLSQSEIDQLVMQATFGKDEYSLATLKKAADRGQVEAETALGKSYLFKQQSVQAKVYLEQAVKHADIESAVLLGKLYFKGDVQTAINYEYALTYFQIASQNNDPVAAYYLGLMYKNGYAVKTNDAKAVEYFQTAARHKIPSAMFMLANAYQYGIGVKVDLNQAYHWYKQAAEMELPEAIQELAYIYRYGNGAVPANQTAYQQQLLEIGHSLKHPAITP